MHPTQTLAKILNIREKEKKDAQLAHYESTVHFEKVATKLHSLLVEKENVEKSYEKDFGKITSIDKIREQMAYIDYLTQQIVRLQEQVNEARNTMEVKQVKLTDAHVEVKKYEKIIEFRKHEQLKSELRKEQIMMDEVSTQQYVSRK